MGGYITAHTARNDARYWLRQYAGVVILGFPCSVSLIYIIILNSLIFNISLFRYARSLGLYQLGDKQFI